MITAVDTNILLDIFIADAQFGLRSKSALRRCMQEGSVFACDVVWGEAATYFDNIQHFIDAVRFLGIDFLPMNEEAALVSAEVWREYRKSGGNKNRILPDFLIGAHAMTQCDRLLTRDRGFYRKYFNDLVVVTS